MICASDSTVTVPASQLLSLGQASTLLKIDPQALRRLANRGVVKTVVLPSGHRRFIRNNILEVLGTKETSTPSTSETIRVGICVRTSSEGQNRARGKSEASDQDRQREQMKEFVSNRFAGQNISVTMYERCASSVNFSHPVLLKMLEDCLDRKLDYLCIRTKDRLGRISLGLLEWLIAERGGCKIIYAEENTESGSDAELCDEILACLHHFCMKKVGKRTRERHKIYMSPELLKRTWKLHCGGVPIRSIVDTYNREGIKDEKGRAYKRHVVFTLIEENREQLTTLYGLEGQETSFTKFLNQFVVETGKDTDVLERRTILHNYKKWCEANGQEFITDNKTCLEVAKRGWKLKPQNNKRRAFYTGIKLRGTATL